MAERGEAFLRIIVGFISGIVLGLWRVVIQVIWLVHFIYVLLQGNRHKPLAEFAEAWNTQMYTLFRYMNFVSNKRPFPFNQLTKNLSSFEKK